MIIQSSRVLTPSFIFCISGSSSCNIGQANRTLACIDVDFLSKPVDSRKNGDGGKKNGETERKRKKSGWKLVRGI